MTIVETMLYKEFLGRLGHPLNEAEEIRKAERKKNKKKKGSVRYGSFRTMALFCSASNRTNRTNSNLHCSASHLCSPLGQIVRRPPAQGHSVLHQTRVEAFHSGFWKRGP